MISRRQNNITMSSGRFVPTHNRYHVHKALLLLLFGLLVVVVNAQLQRPQQPFNYFPCSVCAGGEVMTNPDEIIPANTVVWLEDDIKCIDMERIAQNASYSPIQCAGIRLSRIPKDICDCAVPPTRVPIPQPTPNNVSPTSEPTTAVPVVVATTSSPITAVPVVEPTSSPTIEPVVVETSSPSSAPVVETSAPSIEPVVATTAPSIEPVIETTTAPSKEPVVETTEPPSTPEPVEGGTSAPASAGEVTGSPSVAPPPTGGGGEETAPPSIANVPAGPLVKASVNVRLMNVTEIMTGSILDWYVNEMRLFLTEFFKTIDDPVSGIDVEFAQTDQKLLLTEGANASSSSNRNRQLRTILMTTTTTRYDNNRNLQGNGTTIPPPKIVEQNPRYPLDTTINVTGFAAVGSSRDDPSFTTDVIKTINDNEAILIQNLKSAPTFTEISYYATVESIIAYDSSQPAPSPSPDGGGGPVPAPITSTNDDDDKFSAAAIAGICIAGLVIITLGINAYTNRRRSYENTLMAAVPPPALERPGTGSGSGGLNGSSVITPSIAMPLDKKEQLKPTSSIPPKPTASTTPKPTATTTPKPTATTSSATAQSASAPKPSQPSLPPSRTAAASNTAAATTTSASTLSSSTASKLSAPVSTISSGSSAPPPPAARINEPEIAIEPEISIEPEVNVEPEIAVGPTSATVASGSYVSGSYARADDNSTIDQQTYLGGGTTVYGGDEMSYAYSLDPGQMGGGGGGVDAGRSTTSGASTSAGPAGTTSGYSTGTTSGVGTGSKSGDDVSSHAMSSLRQNMVSRTVVAPPGKLGIVIDTTLEGPVVHKVNPGSPLEGSLFPGDIIVAIDDVDTRAMSASAITALMVRTANLRRRLTVLSEDISS